MSDSPGLIWRGSFIYKSHINFRGERFGALNTFPSASIPEIKKFERGCGRVLGMIQIHVLKKNTVMHRGVFPVCMPGICRRLEVVPGPRELQSKWLWAAMWRLGTKLRARAASALNHTASLTPSPILKRSRIYRWREGAQRLRGSQLHSKAMCSNVFSACFWAGVCAVGHCVQGPGPHF